MSGKSRKNAETTELGTPERAIAVLSDGGSNARVARLFHTWRDLTPIQMGSDLLNEAIALLPGVFNGGVLVAGAGFIGVELTRPTRHRLPDTDEFDSLVAEARRAAATIRDDLPDDRPLLCIGIDVLATCSRSSNRFHVGQFAAIIRADKTEPLLVPKAYPTTEEERYLHIASNGPLRVFQTSHGMGAILVCHDINAYSPRGTATTSREYRQGWRDNLHREVQNGQPAFALNLAHYLGTPVTFRQAYNAWAVNVGIPLISVAGLDSGISEAWARELATEVLSPSHYPVLDLWEISG